MTAPMTFAAIAPPQMPDPTEPGGDAANPATYTIIIPGKPFAKQRPRFSRAQGRAYTPPETVSFERAVGQIAALHIKAPLAGPLRLTVIATFACPESWSAKKRAATVHRPHTQRPDLDNLVKAVADGLNRIAWADDAQLAEIDARKVWGITEQTIVHIDQIGGAA